MEVFPERDGNTTAKSAESGEVPKPSEWRSSLKGMETTHRLIAKAEEVSKQVRMEVFPERDGNVI